MSFDIIDKKIIEPKTPNGYVYKFYEVSNSNWVDEVTILGYLKARGAESNNVITINDVKIMNRKIMIELPKLKSVKEVKIACQSDAKLIKFVHGALTGLAFCEKQGIIHRDFTENNILYDEGKDEWVLTDFNLAFRARDEPVAVLTSPTHRPPEIFNRSKAVQTNLIDSWSFGIVLAYLLCGVNMYNYVGQAEFIRVATLGVEEFLTVFYKYVEATLKVSESKHSELFDKLVSSSLCDEKERLLPSQLLEMFVDSMKLNIPAAALPTVVSPVRKKECVLMKYYVDRYYKHWEYVYKYMVDAKIIPFNIIKKKKMEMASEKIYVLRNESISKIIVIYILMCDVVLTDIRPNFKEIEKHFSDKGDLFFARGEISDSILLSLQHSSFNIIGALPEKIDTRRNSV